MQQPYTYQPLPQQPQQPQQQQQQQQQQQPPRYMYYYPGTGMAPPQPLMMQPHQQPYHFPQQQQQPRAVPPQPQPQPTTTTTMCPNLQQPPSSLAVTVPLQQLQQQSQSQSHFEFEMLPSADQLMDSDEREHEHEHDMPEAPVVEFKAPDHHVQQQQHNYQDPLTATSTAALSTVKQQSMPVQSVFSTQPQSIYPQQQQPPPVQSSQTQSQFMMMPPHPLPHPHMAFPQHPQQQQQQQQSAQQSEQPCSRCQCRRQCRFRRHCRHGFLFKFFLAVQLGLAVLFSVLAPHWIPLSFVALFTFGIISAVLQNIPCLILFSIGNLSAVWLSTMMLFSTLSMSLRGHGAFIITIIVALICFVQWASLVSGFHFTAKVAKKRYSSMQNQHQHQQPQQHVVVGTIAPPSNHILLPTIQTAQQQSI